MIELTTEEIAVACAGRVVAGPPDGGEQRPERAIVDSRMAAPGDLFFGIAGERTDGGQFAERAIEFGAWGVVVTPEHAARVAGAGAVVIEAADPGPALAGLAGRWAEELAARGARTVGITGSVGKTSTKDILVALLRPLYGEHLHANAANFNT
jgi:UDP-N-acetylmuramyl pentapeptide synthase